MEKAKEEIEAHIAARTGTQQVNIDDDFKNNGTEVDGPVSQNLKQPPVSGGLLNARYAIVFFYNFKVGLHQQFAIHLNNICAVGTLRQRSLLTALWPTAIYDRKHRASFQRLSVQLGLEASTALFRSSTQQRQLQVNLFTDKFYSFVYAWQSHF